MAVLSRSLVVALATLAIAGCSHGTVSELPTSPTSAIALRTLTITPVGGGTIIAGDAAEITSSGPFPATGAALGAFAQYSDGSGQYVAAAWQSSDPDVLIVDGSSLKAIGRGTATLSATAEGQTASETFRVEPNVAGTWSGNYVIDQCTAGSGSMYEVICGNTPGRQPGILPVGTTAPLTFQITKSGTDLSAAAAFGNLRGTITGIDRGQNFLTLKGDLKAEQTTLTIVYWDSRVKTDLMEGFIGFEIRIEGVPSWAQLTAHLDNVTRR